MSRKRYWNIASITVWLILGFTAMDLVGDALSYPFCASDLEPSPMAAPLVEMSLQRPGDQVPTSSPGVHIDCCFCCSSCVEYSPVLGLSLGVKVAGYETFQPIYSSLLVVRELFRPPRIS